MIFGIGLPRSGGQTLQKALCILGYKTVHSPGRELSRIITHCGATAAVEVFAPIAWLWTQYPDSRFILNRRSDGNAWHESCAAVYETAQRENWNHPIWRYQLDQFRYYRCEYERSIYEFDLGGPLLSWDLTLNPDWEPLCDFLGRDVPSALFPRVDQHAETAQ